MAVVGLCLFCELALVEDLAGLSLAVAVKSHLLSELQPPVAPVVRLDLVSLTMSVGSCLLCELQLLVDSVVGLGTLPLDVVVELHLLCELPPEEALVWPSLATCSFFFKSLLVFL